MRPVIRSVVVLGLVLAVYYVVPVGELPSQEGAVATVVALLVGLGLLARLVVAQLRRQLAAGEGDDAGLQIQTLLMLVYATILLFSLSYTALAEATDDQFAGIETKTDGLYFTMTTLATVGFGDVHATGQLARGLVTLQIVFNLVFVGALASMVTGAFRRRVTHPDAAGR